MILPSAAAMPHLFERIAPTANRIGSAIHSAPRLKGIQELITLSVLPGFSPWCLDQPLKWNHWAGFGLIVVAAWLIFLE